jgi:shikimate dehydrogenase
MSAPDRYAVIGHPIAHSRSPQIHSLFAQQTHQDMMYSAIDVAPENLAPRLREFFAAGGGGLNVTVPHKQSVIALTGSLSARARTAGAANTIVKDAHGQLLADNTDGVGLVRDLTHNLRVAVSARRVLLLGAGGAARGVLAPLLELKPRELVIANRSVERALALAHAFAQLGPVSGTGFAQLDGDCFDLIDRGQPAVATAAAAAVRARRRDDLLRSGVCQQRYPLHALGARTWRGAGSHGTRHAGRTGRRILLSLARRATGY